MTLKYKGPIIGIKFRDKEAKTDRYIIVQDFTRWKK